MKVLQIIVAFFVASGSSFQLSYVLPNLEGFLVPNYLNDTFTYVNRSEVERELTSMTNDRNMVKYYLYTKKNPNSSQLLELEDLTSFYKSNLDGENPTRIVIHGYMASAESDLCPLIRDAFLQQGPHNIICVDWSKMADKLYPTGRYAVPSVGNDLAIFIDFLRFGNWLPKGNLILIGHSLGAHISGFAGKRLKAKGWKIPIIIGCDPAMPLFSYSLCSNRLCKDDADYVASIQTCGGRLGFLRPIGRAAYYPNGGAKQPGCGTDLIGSCAHSRSYIYLAEAIRLNDFPTKRCRNYKEAVHNKCEKEYSSVRMGSWESIGVQGTFYVPVNSNSTYGKGN